MSIRRLGVIALMTVACNRGTVEVVIDHPSLGAEEVAILAYDRDAILEALEAPTPDSDLLTLIVDSLPRDIASYRTAVVEFEAARDSLAKVLDALNAYSRSSDEYQTIYPRYGEAETIAREHDRRRLLAFDRLEARRKVLGPRAEEFRTRTTSWEAREEASYRRLAGEAALDRDMEVRVLSPVTADSALQIEGIAAGRWWVYAKVEDPTNPYAELYWNVPVTVQRSTVVQVTLGEANARRRLRGAP